MSHRIGAALLAGALACGAVACLADDGAFASGHLEAGGGYLSPAPGSTVSVLPDGSILVFGLGPPIDERLTQREQTAALRQRREGYRFATPDPDPKLWDAAARGWRRLPGAPACEGFVRYLHTATVLGDGRVLLAGGLCDAPKMADDPSPWPALTQLVLWDSRARKWVEGPSLGAGRIHHSATLMPDGSVILAGGESDPLLVAGDEPVLDSVERFWDNRVDPVAKLLQARARHSATALPDNTLVVAGGFGADGRAMSSVELLAADGHAWRAMPPLHVARHSHTATLLADGRILVAGGKDAQDQALTSTEIWDPVRGAWLAGPSLPVALNGHAAARLANGEVLVAGGAWIASPLSPIPWAWTWSPESGDWRVAGHAIPQDATDLSAGVTIAARPDDTALVFTSRTILRWTAGADAGNPRWDARPSIAALRGARAMFVGYEVGAPANNAIARVWDAGARRWSAAGTPFGRERMEGATAQLPSGRVIHVGIDMENTLVCRIWDPPARWEDCGSAKFEYPHRGRPQLAALPDGRAFVIAGEHEAAVLDEGSRSWKRTRLEWDRANFAYGAPVVHDKPLAQLVDPASGKPVAIEDAGARYYNANLSGGSVAMLWDARASRWAYVFLDARMGADAQWLPDGCAISTWPLALFDPNDASARALADPGLGIESHQSAMVVLDDATVVVAGVSAAGTGGFFHRKASCAGLAAAGEATPYIAPTLATSAAATSTAARAPSPPAPAPQGFAAWKARVVAMALEYRWLLLALAAPILIYAVLRGTTLGQARAPASRGFRVVVYLIIAVVLAPFVLQYVMFYLATSTNECLESPLRCKSDPPWWVALARKAKPAPAPPCKLVGVWSSQRGARANPIELKDDGTYAMTVDGRLYTGLWRVEDGRMIWQHEQAHGARDVNPMEVVSDTRFNLTEENGQVTRFERIRAVASDKCTP
jgi:hypothetical protein